MLVVILIVIGEIHLWPSTKALVPLPAADVVARRSYNKNRRALQGKVTNARRPGSVCARDASPAELDIDASTLWSWEKAGQFPDRSLNPDL
jgi:hypothetical protein